MVLPIPAKTALFENRSGLIQISKSWRRRRGLSPALLGSLQWAPFNVHEVVQVVVTPRSHFLQTATHWSIDFEL
jgi:hypothetical protein